MAIDQKLKVVVFFSDRGAQDTIAGPYVNTSI